MTLEKACKKLLMINPFYGVFLLGINKRYSNLCNTACVTIRGIDIELHANKEWFEALPDQAAIRTLWHECLHICFKHLLHYDDFPGTFGNYCTDMEVNSWIPDMKKWLPNGVFAENYGLEPCKGTLYYWNTLKKKYPDMKQLCDILDESGELIDDHSHWGTGKSLSDAKKKLVGNQIDAHVKRAAEETIKARGNIPGELTEYINTLLHPKPPVYNWRAAFRRVVGNSITSEIYLTKMRPSKRFPDARGIKNRRKPEILIGIDTSGSVRIEDAKDFFSEVHHIWKTGIKVTVAECDTKITEVFEYDGKKRETPFKGRGGTILKPLVEYYKAHRNFSSLVMFTDGYCETDLSARNLIWVITRDGNQSQKFNGIQINMPQE